MKYEPANDELITSRTGLTKWVNKLKRANVFSFDTETTGLDTWTCDLVGVSLAVHEGDDIKACYIPLAHTKAAAGKSKQLRQQDVLGELLSALADPNKRVIMANPLFDQMVLSQPRYRIGHAIRNIECTMVKAYALDGMKYGRFGMDFLAEKDLGWSTIKFSDVVIPQLGRNTFADVPLKEATNYAAEDSAVTLMLGLLLDAKLQAEGMTQVDQIDQALIPVLYDMKMCGVLVDVEKLKALETLWTAECAALEKKMDAIAGAPINPGSPKQVAELLFAKPGTKSKFKLRGLVAPKQTYTGKDSTDGDVMDELAGDKFVDVLSDWRGTSKLLTTYAIGLQGKINPTTGRVHGDIRSTRTSTGRFASADPNLQNIPTRTANGVQLREAFVAQQGRKLIAADYSQIEYRILAHICQDEFLLKAYRDGIDLHALMAATVRGGEWQDYNNKKDGARYKVRSAFKNINFAIVYGAGPNKVAKMSGIDVAEAYDLLDAHREMAPGVYTWKDDVLRAATRNKYSETLFGRRIHVPNIGKRHDNGHGQRLAINGAVQGSAADLMRLAMPKVRHDLMCTLGGVWSEQTPHADILLTVHDELVLECDVEDVEPIAETVKIAMETCADHLVQWTVPIVAEVGSGQNWREAK